MKRKKKRKLEEIRPEEISYVDAPANLSEFFLVKRRKEGQMMEEIKKLYKSLMGEDLNEKQIEMLKKIPDDVFQKLVEALKELETIKEDLPEALRNAINFLIGWTTGKYPYPYPYPAQYPYPAKYPYPTREELVKIISDLESLLARLKEEGSKEGDQGEQKAEKSEKGIVEELNEVKKALQELIKKAEETKKEEDVKKEQKETKEDETKKKEAEEIQKAIEGIRKAESIDEILKYVKQIRHEEVKEDGDIKVVEKLQEKIQYLEEEIVKLKKRSDATKEKGEGKTTFDWGGIFK